MPKHAPGRHRRAASWRLRLDAAPWRLRLDAAPWRPWLLVPLVAAALAGVPAVTVGGDAPGHRTAVRGRPPVAASASAGAEVDRRPGSPRPGIAALVGYGLVRIWRRRAGPPPPAVRSTQPAG